MNTNSVPSWLGSPGPNAATGLIQNELRSNTQGDPVLEVARRNPGGLALPETEGECRKDVEALDIHFCNRGYAPLLAARLPSSDVAWADLRAMDVRNRPQAKWDGWFAADDTPLVKRWLVTMAVLRYIRENATTITPTWKGSHGRSLARSS
ncbi:MAG: hypothetical protein OXE73_08445 [Gammaproteobacteria bacterium]|nr:hypothetical protein [Gammaproteobacteria bacterium]